MTSWRENVGRAIVARPSTTSDNSQDSRGDAGEYRLLHKYLRERFANRLVLTFAEIEDLLGFGLPEPARLQIEWWGKAGGPPSPQSDAWRLAGRSATVNLAAQIVVFERDTES